MGSTVLNCNANIYFNQKRLKNGLIPKYVNIKDNKDKFYIKCLNT